MSNADLDDLQRRIGHHFSDEALLERALTHSSLSGGEQPVAGDLERLEFLGDRVLGLLTAEELWRRFPALQEGELAPRLNALVRKETCAEASLAFGLDKVVRLSAQEEGAGGRKKTAILGDVCEAFLGALYIDGGLEAARRAFDLYWLANIEKILKQQRDPKTALQEWSQERKKGTPSYEVLDAQGPAHAPHFKIQVRVKGLKPALGEGGSKRAAQAMAAQALLLREGIWSDDTSS